MSTSNNALVPDPDKQDDLASAPWQWPLLNVGLRMCGWDDHIIKYFLLGNPLVYWGSTASLLIFVGMVAFYLIRWQRGYSDMTQRELEFFHYAGVYPVIGWWLHYLPFLSTLNPVFGHKRHLLTPYSHGTCHLRPPLLPRALLCHPLQRLLRRLDDEKTVSGRAGGHLFHALRHHHRSLYRVQRYLFRYRGQRCGQIESPPLVGELEDARLDKGVVVSEVREERRRKVQLVGMERYERSKVS